MRVVVTSTLKCLK